MIIRPTAIEQSGTASDYGMTLSGSSVADLTSVPAFYQSSTNSGSITVGVASGLVTGDATFFNYKNSNSFLAWSAEL